jgi:hypothetical protein
MTETGGRLLRLFGGPQTCRGLIALAGVNYCTLFGGPKPPKYRRGHKGMGEAPPKSPLGDLMDSDYKSPNRVTGVFTPHFVHCA